MLATAGIVPGSLQPRPNDFWIAIQLLVMAAIERFKSTVACCRCRKEVFRSAWEIAPALSEEAKSFLKGTRENKTENVFGKSNN